MLVQNQLRELIIQPVLKAMNLHTQCFEDLLIGTIASKSYGEFLLENLAEKPALSLVQRTSGLGLYFMTPQIHDDIWKIYLPSQPKITNDMMQVCCFSRKPTVEMLVYNLYYSTAMMIIYYKRTREPIPKGLELQAAFYKTFYDLSPTDSSVEDYIKNYNRFMGIKQPRQKRTYDESTSAA